MALKSVKHRCNFCLKPLRPDGTCANPECPRYVPEDEQKNEKKDEGSK